MSVKYRSIHWNRQKKRYDGALAALLALYLVLFAAVTLGTHPNATIETLIIRATSSAALFLLHIILCIGPLARLDRRFLPLLYNRRHLGVTMFVLAATHAAVATFQFHALGNFNPIVSVFTAYASDFRPFARPSGRLGDFPFEPFGALALAILFFMAATSHDFWLRNLGPSIWKALHMGVYVAYGAVLAHVAYGALQSERNPVYVAIIAIGFLIVFTLHLLAYRKETLLDRLTAQAESDGFVDVCALDVLREGHGKVVRLGKQRIGVFLHGGRVFALSNVCRHQGGPVGEGRIVDGCATCPWHGWQYRPDDGCSPPPFAEVIPTYQVRVIKDRVCVHPTPNALRTRCDGVPVEARGGAEAADGEFYIGYLKAMPPRLARHARTVVAAMAVLVVSVSATVAALQHPFDSGEFEFGLKRTFEGVLYEDPIPMLRIVRTSDAANASANLLLVGWGKTGLPAFARGHGGKKVRFAGSLICRRNMTMIEMNDAESFEILGEPEPAERRSRVESLGNATLTGELVDTKCFFGVMRPATGKVHRACAVRCLYGGAPPGLLVRDAHGGAFVALLAGPSGRPLEYDVEWAALNVTATGTLELHDGVPVLRADSLSPTEI